MGRRRLPALISHCDSRQYYEWTSIQQLWADDVYLQMEHKQIITNVTNEMCIKTAINVQLKINHVITEINHWTAVIIILIIRWYVRLAVAVIKYGSLVLVLACHVLVLLLVTKRVVCLIQKP